MCTLNNKIWYSMCRFIKFLWPSRLLDFLQMKCLACVPVMSQKCFPQIIHCLTTYFNQGFWAFDFWEMFNRMSWNTVLVYPGVGCLTLGP